MSWWGSFEVEYFFVSLYVLGIYHVLAKSHLLYFWLSTTSCRFFWANATDCPLFCWVHHVFSWNYHTFEFQTLCVQFMGIQMPPLALPPSWWPQNAWDSPTRKSPDVTRCHRRCCSTLYCSLSRYAKLKTVPLMLHPICVPVQMPNLNTLVEVASQMMNWCILWRNEGLMPIVHDPYAFLCVCSGMKLSKGSCCGHQANTLFLA